MTYGACPQTATQLPLDSVRGGSARRIDDIVEVLHGELFGVAAAFDRRFGVVEPLPVELDAGEESLTGVVPVVTAESSPTDQ